MKKLKFIIISLLYLIASNVVYAQDNDDYGFFEKTVQDLLQEKIMDDRISIEPDYNSQTKFNNIRSNQDKIQSIVLETFDPKSSNFGLKILYIDGKSETLSGKAVSYVTVPIAARYIKFGEIIQSIDLNNLKVKLNTVRNSDVIGASEIVGMQAKAYIARGSVIKRGDIANPPVIKNNDPVNIIYTSGVINLKTTGIAMGSGAVGDMIKIKNSTSGVVLLGQIVNKNTVQVSGNNNE